MSHTEEDYDEFKFVQIMAAPPYLECVYGNDDGTVFSSTPLCIALRADGHIVVVDMDSYGCFDNAANAVNFAGFCNVHKTRHKELLEKKWKEKTFKSRTNSP